MPHRASAAVAAVLAENHHRAEAEASHAAHRAADAGLQVAPTLHATTQLKATPPRQPIRLKQPLNNPQKSRPRSGPKSGPRSAPGNAARNEPRLARRSCGAGQRVRRRQHKPANAPKSPDAVSNPTWQRITPNQVPVALKMRRAITTARMRRERRVVDRGVGAQDPVEVKAQGRPTHNPPANPRSANRTTASQKGATQAAGSQKAAHRRRRNQTTAALTNPIRPSRQSRANQRARR